MLTRILSILGISLLLSGCAVGTFPKFPSQIKDHYVVDAPPAAPLTEHFMNALVNPEALPAPRAQGPVDCLHFAIISTIPYQIKFVDVQPIQNCNGVGGYLPSDSELLYNWFDDVAAFAKTHEKCFK